MDYTELVQELRGNNSPLTDKAADAIEELIADLERAEDYAEAWEGLANDCKEKFVAFVEKMKR